MIDLLFVALFQAVVGAPEAAPEQAAAATTQESQAEPEAGEAEEETPRRRCHTRDLTGSRLRTVVTCRNGNGHQNENARSVMEQLQRPPGTTSN